MAKFKKGQEVIVTLAKGETTGEIDGYSKGWYQVTTMDGNIRKVREAKLRTPGESARSPKPRKEAKKPAADDTNGRDIIRKDIRAQYVRHKPEGQKPRFDCGDTIAEALRGIDRKGIVKVAAETLEGMTVNGINSKYGHLNNGQIRMTLGVRLRGAEVSPTAIRKVRKALNV